MTTPWLLAADIGGTNVRLAAFEGDTARAWEEHGTANATDLPGLFAAFARSVGTPPALVVAAVAGPVSNNAVQLTNARQALSGADLAHATGALQAHLINDFVAAAWATAAPAQEDITCLQGAPLPPGGLHLVVGPGTGLGVGALYQHDGVTRALPGEGGHIGLAPQSRAEIEIFEAFRTLWPDVFFGDSLTCEAEAMLSGTGLPYLYRAVQRVTGDTSPPLDARDVLNAARTGSAAAAGPACTLFRTHLGRVAGDLGLAFGATSVFMVGGVAAKNPWLFDDSFLAAFCQGGRFTGMREAMNVYLLHNARFGLQGALNFARHRIAQGLSPALR
ncbi:MAG: glucokinase [Marinibacterium sp.]